MKDAFPTVKKIVLMSAEENIEADGDVITWQQLLDLGRSTDDQMLDDCEKDQAVNQAAMMLYTSGTTGPPKGRLYFRLFFQSC